MPNVRNDVKVLFAFVRELKNYKVKIIFLLILIEMSSLITMVSPYMVKMLTDEGLIKQNFIALTKYATFNFLLAFSLILLSLIEQYLYININTNYKYNMLQMSFSKLLNFKMSYFETKNYAQIVNQLDTDIDVIARVSSQTTFKIIEEILMIIGGSIGLLLINWKLMIIILVFIPIKVFIVIFFSKLRKKRFSDYIDNMQKYYSWLGDAVSGIKELKLFGLKNLKREQYKDKQKKVLKSNNGLMYLDNFNVSADSVITNLITLLIYVGGMNLIMGKCLTVGDLIAFISYGFYVTQPLYSIINMIYSCQDIIKSGERYNEFMRTETEGQVKDIPLNNNDQKDINDTINNNIVTFDKVSFSYDNGKQVFDNLNFSIRKGEKIAIVGENGSGKTTLINLLLRFSEPQSGDIFYDGQNIEDFDIDEYRSKFSVVCQSPYLFNDTIKNNIDLIGTEDDNVDKACKISNLSEFIKRLPQKLDTNIGSNGTKLSGGERQKIAISRVVLRNSPIVILDEADNNLDKVSDTYLIDLIFKYFEDKTVILITHRSDILERFDKTLDIKNYKVSQNQEVF